MSYISLEEAAAGRKNNFDFLRFLLASLVIFTHSFALLHKGVEPLAFLTHNQKTLGTAAVDFFFVISGFLIANSWQHSKNALDYLKKRVLRIYPGYIVVVLLSIFVFGLVGADNRAAYLHSIAPGHLLIDIIRLHKIIILPTFLHNPEPGDLNGSLWSIAIEFECYILLMLVGWAGLLRRREAMLVFFAVCVLLSIGLLYPVSGLHQLSAHLPLIITDKLRVVTCFLSGTTFYLYKDKIYASPRLLALSLAILVVAAITTGFAIAMMLCGAYVLFYIAFSPKVKLHDWAKRADLSYGIYLYGWPVQQLTILVLGKSLDPYLLTLIALPLACLCAAASWFCIERPFLRLKQTRNREKSEVS